MVLKELDVVLLNGGEIGTILEVLNEDDGDYLVEVFQKNDTSGVPLYVGFISLTEMSVKLETINGENVEIPIDSTGKNPPLISYKENMVLCPW